MGGNFIDFRCKLGIKDVGTWVFIVVVMSTTILYVFGFVELRPLYFSKQNINMEDIFGTSMRKRIDEVYILPPGQQMDLAESEKELRFDDLVELLNETMRRKVEEIYKNHFGTPEDTTLTALGEISHDSSGANQTSTEVPQHLPRKVQISDRNATLSVGGEKSTTSVVRSSQLTLVLGQRVKEIGRPTARVVNFDGATTNSGEIQADAALPPQRSSQILGRTPPSLERHAQYVRILRPPENVRKYLRGTMSRHFNQRKERLRKFCGQHKRWVWLDEMQMLAVPERDLVVCTVQKTGSTSWHKFVHHLRFPDRQWDSSRKQNWKFAKDLPKNTKRRLTYSRNATRVITVRHPFARLVSAWNNKFQRSFVEKNGNKMLQSMPDLQKYIGRHTADSDHVIAFEDFAQYIADYGLDQVDVHVKSIGKLCSPCSFPYDYVLKSETVPEDSWYVTEKLNSTLGDFTRSVPTLKDPLPSISEYSAAARYEQEARVISRLFRDVPRATTRALMRLYADDFSAFGYTFDVSTLAVGGYEN